MVPVGVEAGSGNVLKFRPNFLLVDDQTTFFLHTRSNREEFSIGAEGRGSHFSVFARVVCAIDNEHPFRLTFGDEGHVLLVLAELQILHVIVGTADLLSIQTDGLLATGLLHPGQMIFAAPRASQFSAGRDLAYELFFHLIWWKQRRSGLRRILVGGHRHQRPFWSALSATIFAEERYGQEGQYEERDIARLSKFAHRPTHRA